MNFNNPMNEIRDASEDDSPTPHINTTTKCRLPTRYGSGEDAKKESKQGPPLDLAESLSTTQHPIR